MGLGGLFFGYLTIPHFVYFYFALSSVAVGLLIYAIALLIIYSTRSRKFKITALQFSILALATASICIYKTDDISRQIFSLIAIAVIFLSTNMFFGDFTSRADSDVKGIIKTLFYALLLIGLAGKLSLFNPGNYAVKETVFPFSEPSHYALSLGPIACAYMLQLKTRGRLSVAVVVLLLGLWFPNSTLLAESLLLFIVILRFWVQACVATLAILLALSIGVQGLEELPHYDYFAGRLGLLDERENLTFLVYKQGWQQAAIAFSENYGLGIGFQRFGQESAGDAANRIDALYGIESNRMDGSNLGSKLVGEFGYVGIILSCSMVIYSSYCLIRLRRILTRCHIDHRYTVSIFYAFSYMYLIEVVFRGLSYFDPWFFIFCFGVSQMTRRAQLFKPHLSGDKGISRSEIIVIT